MIRKAAATKIPLKEHSGNVCPRDLPLEEGLMEILWKESKIKGDNPSCVNQKNIDNDSFSDVHQIDELFLSNEMSEEELHRCEY